jgi:hypothetical protein
MNKEIVERMFEAALKEFARREEDYHWWQQIDTDEEYQESRSADQNSQ